MEEKHTPGRWTIRRDAPDPANPRGVIRNLVGVEGSGPVAEVCAPAGRGWPERCDANAALIAAAPDLAEACAALVRLRDAEIDAGEDRFPTCSVCEDPKCTPACPVEMARRALLKAGGR